MATGFQKLKASIGLKRITGSPPVRLAFVLLVGLIALAMFFVHRSFLVEAETSYAELTFGGEVNTWAFPSATVCVPRDDPDLEIEQSGDAVCNPMLYAPYVSPEDREDDGDVARQSVAGPRPLSLSWSCGARVSLQADTDGAMVITVLGKGAAKPFAEPCRAANEEAGTHAAGHDFGEGTIIVVDAEAWRENGALPFQAQATLGEDIGPGAIHYLQEGRWEARQTSRVLEALGVHSVTEVVKSGEFSIGAEATIYEGEHRAVMFGQITPVAVERPNSLPGFDVVMLSAPGNTELRLAHFGFEESVSIRPDWVDTAINSPIFLALFTLLSFFAVVFQIIGDWPFRSDGPAADKDGSSDKSSDSQASES